MLKAYKYRIYPDTEQQVLLAKSFGCCRWFYNYALNLTNQTYKESNKGLSRNHIINLLPDLKQQYEWLKDAPSQALQQVALDLSSAFLNFFEKRARFPRFKKKRNRQSVRLPQGCKLDGDYLKLPKFGQIYCKVSRLPKGKLKSVTISQNPSGSYYASCLYNDDLDKPESATDGKSIGIDLGLKDYVITSDGNKYGNPKHYQKSEKKLAKKQKALSKKQKGSKNRNKGRVKVAKVQEKITRCREDFLHKLSRKLVDENQIIVVENLAVKNLVKNPKLAKAISDCSWGQFCTMLKYKAEWDGKMYIEVDRFFPSSKTCNNCLYQLESLKLDIRSWQCPRCGTMHDRDINAAKNIRDEGLRIMAVGRIASASGERVRPSKGTAFTGHHSLKEESSSFTAGSSQKLLFVCLGNICRSPSAENIMNHLIAEAGLEKEIICDSAGTSSYHIGEPPDKRMTLAAKKRGIPMYGEARQFSRADFEKFDLILAMDKDNYQNILYLDREQKYYHKVKLMCDYATRHQVKEVPDPYYGGSDGFNNVIDLLLDACEGLLTAITQQSEINKP